MAGASVIGLVLRLDVRGWEGAPPRLPDDPVKIETGRDTAQSFFYDLMPKDVALDVESLCVRFASRFERWILSAKSPLAGCELPYRLALETGLLYDADSQFFETRWSADFLRVAGEAQMELIVSHYRAEHSQALISEDD
ncbi:MAG: hypothetical protein FJX29_08935 [Alphaproteobacteria bacterium]|nr:hypothetical protein [Alphaproteobacteria bacterium]